MLDDRIDKRQSASFSAQRALPDAGKVGVVVESVAVKHCHYAAVLHLSVLHYEVEEKLSHRRGFADVHKAVHLDNFGNGEHGA